MISVSIVKKTKPLQELMPNNLATKEIGEIESIYEKDTIVKKRMLLILKFDD